MGLNYIATVMRDTIEGFSPALQTGRVVQVTGTVIKAIVPRASVGEMCSLYNPGSEIPLHAEVVGFEKEVALLTPIGDMSGVSTSTAVTSTGVTHRVRVGPELKGRILNGMGEPIDGAGRRSLQSGKYYSVDASPPEPLTRELISTPLATGVSAIDALITCGEGQRMGIFAAAGAGKSTLLGMLVKHANVDITVVALIGERGREVREFVDLILGSEGMEKSVLVVATSDRPAMERVKAAYVATSIAEYFRDQGMRVLLLMDSVTRFARALREIGLAAGETPTRRGFPSSVFATLPKLMERAGNSDKGSITAFYTVLVEGDDLTEPVADETRSILDGHIVLSRELAAGGQYPAIDILDSLSRVMSTVVTPEHIVSANKLRGLMAKYKEIELLVRVGEYQKGHDVEADEALEKIGAIRSLLKQDVNQHTEFEETLEQLRAITGI